MALCGQCIRDVYGYGKDMGRTPAKKGICSSCQGGGNMLYRARFITPEADTINYLGEADSENVCAVDEPRTTPIEII